MSRKERRQEAARRRRDYVLTMIDGFREYRQQGNPPSLALALVQGDMAKIYRRHPTDKSQVQQAMRDFNQQLQQQLAALS